MSGVERKERKDKKKRIFPYLKHETYRRLNRLSKSCDVSVHELAADLLDATVNTPAFINWIQDKHKVAADDPLRVIPLIENGKVRF